MVQSIAVTPGTSLMAMLKPLVESLVFRRPSPADKGYCSQENEDASEREKVGFEDHKKKKNQADGTGNET
ncbi:hypothetical protein MASR1M36_03030 [Candidatus Cloacimonadaceae bacterium]